MRRSTAAIAATALFLLMGTAEARQPSTPDKLLAGRTAGKPDACISVTRIVDSQTFDDGSIFYRMGGGPDYLQRPRDCSQLNSSRAYVNVLHSSQLCSGDTLRVIDAVSHFSYGSCIYTDFIPYPRVRRQ
jgi:hypothetical protein